ncbi:MAG TPA: hypothetical protein VHW66_24035 [Stellaceae bacterium]|jgi:hypothetical protein|nr:hypothetical protein [Stellaceae bacterium]
MIRRRPPGVLVVEEDAAASRRLAGWLEEAGIVVTAVTDRASALSAVARCRFDLAVVGPALVGACGGIDLPAEFRARRLGLAVASQDRDGPRRFVGRVRERLLGGDPMDEGGREAELCIAAAKLACLAQRSRDEDVYCEIAETVAHHRSLLRASLPAAEAVSA